MCEPITAAIGSMSAMEIAGTAFSIVSKLAEASERDAQAARERKAADDSYNAQMAQLQLQRNQENQKVGEEMSQRAREATAAEARLRVSAGESGVSGASVDRVSQEINIGKTQDMATLEGNRKAYMMQTTAEGQGIAAQRQSRMNEADSRGSGGAFGVGLQIAGSVLNGATMATNRIARQGLAKAT